jgi:3-isopropylmalate/(R)-2-methylmalate dehydratase small subunit
VDTDQIIPARFLKATERVGFGDNLFRDWRYNGDDTPKADFVLNDKTYSGKILVGGKNFGSGSSREHAAWAVYDYGFRAVVSSFFADIFKGNCLNIGVLPVQVSPEFADTIFKAIEADPKTELEINLPEQTITLSNWVKKNLYYLWLQKDNMINGFDDIDYLQNIKEEIVGICQ